MNKGQKTKDKGQIVWLLFAFLIVFVYFSGLTIPLLGPDEPRYSQIAREMFERGDWITPKLGGFDWFEKPVLLYWLQIASYKLFGVNEFAARFGSTVFGLGTIFSLWILGKSVQSPKSKVQSSIEKAQIAERQNLTAKTLDSGLWTLDFAGWLALIAASSIGLIAFSRGASFDIILTFPITAALVCYFIFETYLQKHYYCAIPGTVIDSKSATVNIIAAVVPPIIWAILFLSGFYFFIGVALIAKGLVGIVFPLAVVFFYHLLKFELLPGRIFLVSLFWGMLLSLLVASVWYLPMYQANGWKFIDEFFIQHHFQRFTSDKYQHHQPFWFFFAVLPLMTIPWLPFFLASIWSFFKSQIANRKSQVPDNLSTFAFAWMLVPLVFFSLSGSKLPGYILPSLPGALILTAIYIYKFVGKSESRARVLQFVAAAVLVFTFVVLRFFAAEFIKPETVKYMIETVDAKNFADARFVSLFTVSHNLEFYAAGRLERGTDGKLKRYDDFSVLVRDLKENVGERVLVVAPQEVVPKLQEENNLADVETIAENGDSAIILVTPR